MAGGSITEIIYYLDMDNYLVARDLTSNYPVKALSLPSVGYVRNLATEGLLSLMPTLVLGEADAGPPNVIEKLREIKVDVRIVKTSHDAEGVIKKTLCVGNIMGMSAEQLDAKTRNLRGQADTLRKATLTNGNKKNVLLILMMRGTSPIVAGTNTTGDGFIKMTGNYNVFSDVVGWKPVGTESILAADPDIVIVTTRAFSGFASVSDFFEKNGLGITKAGRDGALIVEDTMEMLGFGPRTPGAAARVASKIRGQ